MPRKISTQVIEKVKEGLERLRKNPGVKASVDIVGIVNPLDSGELDKAIKERDSDKITSIFEKGLHWDEAYFFELPPVTDFPKYSTVQSLQVELCSSSTDDMALLHRLLSSTKNREFTPEVENSLN